MKVLRQFFWFMMFLVMLAAAAAGGYAVHLEREDRTEIAALRKEVADFEPRFTKFKAAVGDLSKGFTSLVLEEIDLTRGGWQPLGKGFYLVDVGVAPQGKGVHVRGKIINASAVVHENLVFKVRVQKGAATITLARAAPAVALPFEVTLPDVPAAEAQKAFFELESSTISFASTTGKSPAGREPFDPDKILRGGN